MRRMRDERRRGRRLRAPSPYELAAIVLAMFALGGAAYAAIPSADGTIKACYATTNGLLLGIPHSKGDLRVVDQAESCRSYEKPLSWIQATPAGVAGYEIVVAQTTADTNQLKSAIAECPAGKKVVGGGASIDAPVTGQRVISASEPLGDNRWRAIAQDLDPSLTESWAVRATAICAAGAP